MKKKSIAILMCGIMSVTLFACGGNNASKSSTNAPSTSSSQSKSITSSADSSKSGSMTSSTGGSKSSSTTSSTDNSKSNSHASGTDVSNMKLTEMISEICKDTKVPTNDIIELNKENFEAYGFIKWTDGIEAACSEGMISTDAHSLVLIKANGSDTKAMAEEIAKKADPRKWICVGAETSKVLYTDKYVLLAMTYEKVFDGIKANFEKLMGNDAVKVMDIEKAGKLE